MNLTGNPAVDIFTWMMTGINAAMLGSILLYASFVMRFSPGTPTLGYVFLKTLTFAGFVIGVYCPALWLLGVPDDVARILTAILTIAFLQIRAFTLVLRGDL